MQYLERLIDWPELAAGPRLYRRAIQADVPVLMAWLEDDAYDSDDDDLAHEQSFEGVTFEGCLPGLRLLVDSDGDQVAFVHLYNDEIFRIQVRLPYRGRGLGRELVEYAAMELHTCDIYCLQVQVDVRAHVVGFWQSVGFSRCVEDQNEYGVSMERLDRKALPVPGSSTPVVVIAEWYWEEGCPYSRPMSILPDPARSITVSGGKTRNWVHLNERVQFSAPFWYRRGDAVLRLLLDGVPIYFNKAKRDAGIRLAVGGRFTTWFIDRIRLPLLDPNRFYNYSGPDPLERVVPVADLRRLVLDMLGGPQAHWRGVFGAVLQEVLGRGGRPVYVHSNPRHPRHVRDELMYELGVGGWPVDVPTCHLPGAGEWVRILDKLGVWGLLRPHIQNRFESETVSASGWTTWGHAALLGRGGW